MNIIIIGGGKVGIALIEKLVGEGHNIVLMDTNPKVVDNIVNTYDVLGICAHGASISGLSEAGAQKAYLVIAVTDSDELNILCCLSAKMLGTRHSICRVRQPEYAKQLDFMRNKLGISMMVNPEYEAAAEIARTLRFPSAIKIDIFAKGRVDLAEIKLAQNSNLINKPLREMNMKNKVLVCAVQREGDTIIPDGNFVPLEGDRIHITASHSRLTGFFKECGMFKKPVRTAMIVGGGRIAYYLTQELDDLGIQVKLIESDEKRAAELSEALPGVRVILGDGTDQALLVEEGIENVDAFVALTGIDEENIILSVFAQSHGVEKVIAKINRPGFEPLLSGMGVESVISPRRITANHILRYVRGKQNSQDRGVQTLYKIANDSAEALEMLVGDNDDVVGVSLKDLHIKENVIIACIIRNSKVIYPGGDDCIMAGDSVIIVTSDSAMNDIDDILEQGNKEV